MLPVANTSDDKTVAKSEQPEVPGDETEQAQEDALIPIAVVLPRTSDKLQLMVGHSLEE